MRRLSRVSHSGPNRVPLRPETVSALMIVRNRATLLRSAADSVLAQAGCRLELIIVDDGSTDDSVAVAGTLAEHDPRVRVLRNSNRPGIPGARNFGLANASGEYLAICDSDDLSRPDRFRIERDALRCDPTLGGVGGRISCFTDHPEHGSVPDWRWGLTKGRPPFPFPAAMFRMDAVKMVGGFDETFAVAEDLDLAYRLAATGWGLSLLDDVLVDYRLHGQGITSQNPQLALLTLRAQLRGLRGLRGRWDASGYAALGQSLWRSGVESYRNRFSRATAR